MKRILVTGGDSQLALCLSEIIKNRGNDYEYLFKSKDELDITSIEALTDFFKDQEFDVCINCAAYTNVELAEDEPERAMQVNAAAVHNLAILCKEFNKQLIHVSTDYVFDGNSSNPYKETDDPNPINSYGRSKLQGELIISKELTDYYIIRSSWLYSPYGKNFVKTMFELLSQNKPINVVNSQIGSPTSCYDLAKFLIFLIEEEPNNFGIIHFASNNKASWYDIVRYMSESFNEYPKEQLKPIMNYPSKAARPHFSVLAVNKVENMYAELRSWEQGVDEVLNKLREGYSR